MPSDKKTARETGLKNRRMIPEGERRKRAKELHERLKPVLDRYDVVGCYVSMKDELDTYGLIAYCFETGKTVCVPKVTGDTLIFREITSFEDLEEGVFGVREPFRGRIIEPEDIGLMIVPLSAYDEYNHRTGYGRGYYDRVLNEHQYKLGIAFREQEADLIETDPWDITLDEVREA